VTTIHKEHLVIKAAAGDADAWVVRPESNERLPAVLFFPDALLLRPAVHAMAERLAGLGYHVLLPNVFYRSGDIAPFNPHTVWGDPPERARLMAVINGVSLEQAMHDADAYLSAIEADARVVPHSTGVVGYCMGGRWAFALAGHHPERVRAVGAFHAGSVVTDKPDSPHLLANRIQARLYFGIADEDAGCSPEHQSELAKVLSTAHVHYTLELYKGKKHGYAVPDFPVFDVEAAERHWRRIESLFGESLPRA
jgi:carboxymethylenebutenolidase